MDYLNEIYLLSQKFINDYPLTKFPELMYKHGRPYNCLLIETQDDYFICVPYRSNIHHKNAFMFKNTQRSMQKKSGLDYSKIVLIKNHDYLDNTRAVVDQDEYKETVTHLPIIVSDVIDYVLKYKNHVNGTDPLHPGLSSKVCKFF